MVGWVWPLLSVVRTTLSPPVAAMLHLRSVDADVIYVDDRLGAHAALMMGDLKLVPATGVPPVVYGHRGVLLREGASVAEGSATFRRGRERLAGVARNRYFETSVVPLRQALVVTEGGRVRVTLPPGVAAGELTIRLRALESCAVAVRLDGVPLDRFSLTEGSNARNWSVTAPRELTIEGCDSVALEWLALVPQRR